MQMQAIKQNSDENHAMRSDMQRRNESRGRKLCNASVRQSREAKQGRQSLIYMQEKTDRENDACNANDKAMSDMQWFRWAYLEDLRLDQK